MGFDPETSAGFLANHLARLFAQHLAAALAPFGLAPAPFMTLTALWEEPGLTQAELCQRLDVEQATMAGTLGRMARDGLIRRERDPRDGRAAKVFPTERAVALEGAAKAAALSVNRLALEGIAAEQQAEFLAALRSVIVRLQAARPGDGG